jgi:hypothetical protein
VVEGNKKVSWWKPFDFSFFTHFLLARGCDVTRFELFQDDRNSWNRLYTFCCCDTSADPHCLRHLNSCSLLWFCLINIICIYFLSPPTSHKTHRKSFFILRKKQRLLMAVYVYCEREILISTYTIFIYIVNPIYKYISSQLFFWHSFLSLLFSAFFSSFCLHFSASQLLAVIYNVEWGDFADVNWNWMAPKKEIFQWKKKSFLFLSMSSRFLCRRFRATTLNSVSSVHNNNQG